MSDGITVQNCWEKNWESNLSLNTNKSREPSISGTGSLNRLILDPDPWCLLLPLMKITMLILHLLPGRIGNRFLIASLQLVSLEKYKWGKGERKCIYIYLGNRRGGKDTIYMCKLMVEVIFKVIFDYIFSFMVIFVCLFPSESTCKKNEAKKEKITNFQWPTHNVDHLHIFKGFLSL